MKLFVSRSVCLVGGEYTYAKSSVVEVAKPPNALLFIFCFRDASKPQFTSYSVYIIYKDTPFP